MVPFNSNNMQIKKKILATIFTIVFTLSFSLISFSQNPGNVGAANLTAWFKPDALALGNVTSWTTTFPTGASATTVTDGAAPYPLATNTPTGNVSNYNTTIEFTGNTTTALKGLGNTSALDLLDNGTLTAEGTFFAAYYYPTTTITNNHIMLYNEATGYDGIQLRYVANKAKIGLAINGANQLKQGRQWDVSHLPTINSYKGNVGSTTTWDFYTRSKEIDTEFSTMSSGAAGLYFGHYRNGDASIGSDTPYNGYLHEFIFYNRDLTDLEMNKVHTYLAVKYGVTLSSFGVSTDASKGDYIATDGSIIWNNGQWANEYHRDVIGIGRDDSQGLLQKQSHTFDDATRIYLNTLAATNVANGGTFSSDISYLFAGRNNGAMHASGARDHEIPSPSLGSCDLSSRLDREWKITKTNFSEEFSIDITLDATGAGAVVNAHEIRLLVDGNKDFSDGGTACYFNGDAFGTVITYANPVITVSGISDAHIANNSTKYITIAFDNVTPLPISLLSYSANCSNTKPILNWATSSEINNNYFTIEKSIDMVNFEEVGSIKGSGNSSSQQIYQWTDEYSLNKLSYYRLKQTDFDGTSKTIGIVTTDCIKKNNILIYPNPTTKTLFIELGKNYADVNVEIKNVLGQVVQLNTYESLEKIELSINGDNGIYFITISDQLNKAIHHQKIVKQ